MKKAIQKLLVGINQRSQLGGNGKNNVEVIGIDDFAAAFVNPEFLKNCLTVRTVAVAAGVGMKVCIAAFFAVADVIAKLSSFTVHDAVGSLFLDIRGIETVTVILPAVLKNLTDFRITHGKHPPSGREDLPLGK